MWLPGARLTQEAGFSCEPDHWRGAGPIAAIQVQATTSPGPGDGLERVYLPLPGRGEASDLLVRAPDRGVVHPDAVQDQPAHQRVVSGEPAFQRHRQVR